ncbi:MAG: protoporphyrinogen oxidase [Janthinobacterium lividum]
MKIAILGGGIAGLAAAFELEQGRKAGRPLDWHLYEASDRLGGTVQTTRHTTMEGEYILEGGPDAWVTEKTWARELAEELGLGDQIITSKDHDKKTYIWVDGDLVAMPDRMRMMVPSDLAALDASPLFSAEAKAAYAREVERAEELKATAPTQDESVADFVRRHFGEEVLDKIGAPLLSGVFGGDVAKLSVHAVMSAFVKMEAEHGSLVLALQKKNSERGDKPAQATFTSLRRGMGSLVDAIVAALPPERLHTKTAGAALARSPQKQWLIRFHAADASACAIGFVPFDEVFLATPIDATRGLLEQVDAEAAALVPTDASSAVLTTFCWSADAAREFEIPQGFGFLVPQLGPAQANRPKLLAGTFTVQKFPDRAPAGARVVRVFFGGEAADRLNAQSDAVIAAEAWRELKVVLPHMPDSDAALTTVIRWPRSLPQYGVGHGERMAELQKHIETLGNLHLLGNGYHGVGVPDLIRDARAAARTLA